MKDALKIRLAEVLVALPAPNIYLVNIIGVGKEIACTAGTGSESRIGHRHCHSYPPGSKVVVLDPTDTIDEGYFDEVPYIILGGFPYFDASAIEKEDGDITDSGYAKQYLDKQSDTKDKTNDLFNTLRKQAPELFLGDRGTNYIDELPVGSWAKSTAGGGMAYLSNFLARMGISAECFTQYSFTDNRITVNAQQVEQITGVSYSILMKRAQQSLSIKSMSASMKEAMGSINDQAVLKEDDDGNLQLIDETAEAFSREYELSGGYADGLWRTIRTPKEVDKLYVKGSDIQGMISEERRYDGVYSLKAAGRISFQKTNVIPVPVESADIRNAPRSTTDIETKDSIWQALGFSSEEEYLSVRHLLTKEADTAELESIIRKGFRLDRQEGLWLVQQPAEESPEILPKLDKNAPEYALKDLTSEQVTMPDGRSVRLFKNSSAFIMAEDGGFTLSDGYGGSIRMNRGRVTITAAGDIIHQSGRDMVEFVSRNRVLKAKGRIEVTSTEGSIVQKAEENMHLLGGSGGKGGTVIENRAKQVRYLETSEDDIAAGKATGSGITLISSKAGIDTYARRMYIGGMPAQEANQSGSYDACDVIINSGPGSVGLFGHTITAFAENHVGLGLVDGSSIMQLTNASILQMSKGDILAAGGAFRLDSVSAAVTIPRLNGRGYGINNTQNIRVRAPVFITQSDMAVKGSMNLQGQLATNGILSKDGVNGQIPMSDTQKNTFKIVIPASEQTTISARMQAWLKQALDSTKDNLQYGQHTGRAAHIRTLSFPKTNSEIYAASKFSLPMTKWQQILKDPGTWEEKPVDNAILGKTYPYPGTDAYERDDAVVGVDSEGSILKTSLKEYRTNT